MPFRTAHAIAARLRGGAAQARRTRRSSALLAEASGEVLGAPLTYTDGALARILSPRHFVEVRRTLGGPAPAETARALRPSRGASSKRIERWWHAARPTRSPRRSAAGRTRRRAMTRTDVEATSRPRPTRAAAARPRRSRRAAGHRPALWRARPASLQPDACASTGSSSSSTSPGSSSTACAARKSTDKVEGYFLGQPLPAVVGGRPVGDGDAAERDHARRHDRPGAIATACASCSSTSACRSRWSSCRSRWCRSSPRARLHRLRIPRAPLRRRVRGRWPACCSCWAAPLSLGVTLAAPAVVMSAILGWTLPLTVLVDRRADDPLHHARRRAGGGLDRRQADVRRRRRHVAAVVCCSTASCST